MTISGLEQIEGTVTLFAVYANFSTGARAKHAARAAAAADAAAAAADDVAFEASC